MVMSNKIRILDGLVASKIAAGEVIERPASVVKELMENSIDAGATSISLHIKNGGRDLIRLVDNGCGVAPEDAPLTILRHATSKIGEEEDLLRIKTLGFRGEAMASIAAISRLTITTREHGATSGVRLIVEGGGEPRISPAGCAEGTSVAVSDLFFNTPVRLKFLRSAQTESGRILDAFKALALVNPQIRFSMERDTGKDLILPATGLKERIIQLTGLDNGEDLMGISSAHIVGYIGGPEQSQRTAKHLYTYLHGRPIKDRTVAKAVMDGYGRLIERPCYPLALINLMIPPSDVDVNIHPAKTEVRFKNPGAVYGLVRDAVRKALAEKGSGVTPAPVYGRGPAMEAPLPVTGEAGQSYYRGSGRRPAMPEGLFTPDEDAGIKNPEFLGLRITGQVWDEFLLAESGGGPGGGDVGTFYLIDQHGAEERGAYERIKRAFHSGGVQRQLLLIPERIETNAEESEALNDAAERLDKLGFEITLFGKSPQGGDTFIIKSIPHILPAMETGPMILALAHEIAREGGSGKIEQIIEKALMTIACHSVIRGARRLTREEGEEVLRNLARMDFAGYCPHGRPVVKRFSRKEIEGFFKR